MNSETARQIERIRLQALGADMAGFWRAVRRAYALMVAEQNLEKDAARAIDDSGKS